MVRGRYGAVIAALTMGCVGCGTGAAIPTGQGRAPQGPAPQGRSVSPLANPNGTKPGLAPIGSAAEKAKARKLIGELPTKGRGPKTGYARSDYGPAWTDTAGGVPLAHNGCDTRDDLLTRDGQGLRFRAGSDCVVIAMTLPDPYTGAMLHWTKQHATTVQIDHVVPLSYSWQLGASRWPAAKREQLANDPLNLLPVDGPANSGKGDSGPASWLPPNKAVRCAYVTRFTQVALKYALPVTAPDKAMMLAQCD